MAGHSAWSNIKHRKAKQDKIKGKVWSKCSRAIIVAARSGGGDPKFNTTLRYAIDEAKAANMPRDTIEKAVKKGTGDLEGQTYEAVRYEGYGPNGVAVVVDCLTDNVTRTAPEMRLIFTKHGGNLGKPGAVTFGFAQKGLILIEASKVSEDRIMEIGLEAGADDIASIDGAWQITCAPTDFITVKEAIEQAGIEPDSSEVAMLPLNTVECDAETAAKLMKLVDALEEHDDVQKVFNNADISADIMAQLS